MQRRAHGCRVGPWLAACTMIWALVLRPPTTWAQGSVAADLAPEGAQQVAPCDPLLQAQVEALRRELEELRRRDEAQRELLEALTGKVERLAADAAAQAPRQVPTAAPPVEPERSPQDALEAALQELEAAPTTPVTATGVTGGGPALWSRQVGGANLRLIDVSFSNLLAGGWSSVGDDKLGDLELGAHDPGRRGFTLQQAELSFAGAVDPYFTAAAFIVATEDGVELEEAFATTTGLPWGLQVEAGYMFTEFGILNPRHPHEWDWLDQPVIVGRLMGGEGLRSTGARVSWLMPTRWFSRLEWGVQNANPDCCSVGFLDGTAAGRPDVGNSVRYPSDLLWLARWSGSFDLTPETTASYGFSGLFGPNATGGSGRTWIYGLDFRLKWLPQTNFRGFPFLVWQTEIMKRDYRADDYVGGTAGDSAQEDAHGHGHGEESGADADAFAEDLPSAILRDAGGYTQVLWGFRPRWAAGLRFEYANGRGASLDEEGMFVGHNTDPRRDERIRVSPLLAWWPTHFSRLRLQYNYDHARHLPGNDAHTVWVGLEVQFGQHPAHDF